MFRLFIIVLSVLFYIIALGIFVALHHLIHLQIELWSLTSTYLLYIVSRSGIATLIFVSPARFSGGDI